jgi:hypothetical protein
LTAMPQNLQLSGYRKFLKMKGVGAFVRQIKCVKKHLKTSLINGPITKTKARQTQAIY